MKRHLQNALLLLLFILGLSVLLYPTVSNIWNRHVQTQVIVNCESVLEKMDNTDLNRAFAAAERYNEELSSLSDPLSSDNPVSGYSDILNVDGNGTMGSIQIEKIQVLIPIRHSTTSDVLNTSAGHLEGSSLPIGGVGTHAVIVAHRALPSARLFTDLDKLEIGDYFTITILDRTLNYQIDQIKVVEPWQINDLYPVNGKDYCTLMTCTPYGVNTHRLLVRGTRINEAEIPAKNKTEDNVIQKKYSLIVITIFIVVFLIFLLCISIKLSIKRKKQLI